MNPNKPNMPAPAVEPDELSYYRLTLLSYLRESHPERAADDAFVRARADLAAEAFSEAVKSGMDYDEAVRQADEVLFQDLHFSRLDTLITVLWNEFADEVPAGPRPRGGSPALARMRQGVQRLRPDRRF